MNSLTSFPSFPSVKILLRKITYFHTSPSKQLLDRLTRPNDAHRPARGVGEVEVERDSEHLVDGGENVLRGDGAVADVTASRFAGSDDLPSLESSSGQEDGEAVRPVVAPRVAID